ncbi:MAG TPA: hypothetical protein VLT33_23935, partial [Labilithrix sp.]|nr:hypothetical protein [Labilithrix sp.]
ADEPAPAPVDPPAVAAPAPAAEAPAPAAPEPAAPVALAPPLQEPDKPAPPTDEASRDGGLRLGLDLGFARAFDGAQDRLNSGTPTLLPLGADLSFRTSKTFLVGAHGYAALASRDDCISADSCRARGYGFGAHVEGMLARGRSWVFWIRYGIGYEILYQGGLPLDPAGHIVKDAFDLVDFRAGADFTVHRGDDGKTARIGPFMGLVAGALVNQSGVTRNNGSGGQPKNLERDAGSAHVWFALGVRATLDP